MYRIKIVLLSFAFAYNGGLLLFIHGISIHQVQLILAFIALILNISKIKYNIKGLLSQTLPLLLLIIFSLIYYFHVDDRVPIYSSYKIDLYFWNIAIILISTLVVNNKDELFMLIILANIQIIFSVIINFIINNFNLFILREEYIITGRLLGAFIISYFLFIKVQLKKKSLKIIFASCAILSLILLSLSGSRAPIIVLIILFGYKLIANKTLFFKLSYLLLGFLLYLLVANTDLLIFEGKYSYLNRVFGIVTSNISLSEFSNGRIELIDVLLNDEIDYLFGNGVGSTAWMLARTDIRIYPHNLIFELFVELGFIGLSLFTSLIIILYKKMNVFLNINNSPVLRTYISYFLSYSLLTALFSLEFPNQFLIFQSITYLFIINNHEFRKKIK